MGLGWRASDHQASGEQAAASPVVVARKGANAAALTPHIAHRHDDTELIARRYKNLEIRRKVVGGHGIGRP